MAKTTELSPDNFTREVLESSVPVLVDFWSPTCPHCLQLGPEFEKASAETRQAEVVFAKASVVEAAALFTTYGVHAVPTLVLFHDGAEVARREGATTSDQILSWLKEHL
jgi:thioredoxin 2